MPAKAENNMNEVEKFFEELPSEDKKIADVFEEKKEPVVVPEKDKEETEDEGEVRKNRRHRRLEEQLDRERASNIALNEVIKNLSEEKKFKLDSGNDGATDPRLVEVFGSTDEGKKIAKHFGEILEEKTAQAREAAVRELEERQEKVIQEQKQYESVIDSELESLEDKYNIDLTSNAPQANKARREFLEMVQKLSPKDEDGTITEYADFDSTFEIYQQTKQEKSSSNERQKEIASKSMQRSGPVNVDRENHDATERWLNEQGIKTRN